MNNYAHGEPSKSNGNFSIANANTTVSDVIDNQAFNEYGIFMFPIKNRYSYDKNMRIGNINSLLSYHRYINTNTTVNIINYILNGIKNGKIIFYNIYTDTQMQDDQNKKSTGLFFSKENPVLLLLLYVLVAAFLMLVPCMKVFPVLMN